MERSRRSKSKSSKKARRQPSLRKNNCQLCKPSLCYTLVTAHSLYRKYSFSQNHHYLKRFQSIQDKLSESVSTADGDSEEFMIRYHKPSSRKQAMARARQLYGLHKDLPRIYHLFIAQILAKSHHRKRLLQYFKLASTLGLQINSLAFSSFAISVHLPKALPTHKYEMILADSSKSWEVQRQILEAMSSSSPFQSDQY